MVLPETYDPKTSPKAIPRQVMYGIGIRHEENEFGMTFGPYSDIFKCLDELGEPNSFIIRFNADHSDDPIYQWNEEKGLWIKIHD